VRALRRRGRSCRTAGRSSRSAFQLQIVVCAITDHLLDERILSGGGVGRAERSSGEEEGEEEEAAAASHGNFGRVEGFFFLSAV